MNEKHLQDRFVGVVLPAVERHATIKFRNIKCPDRRDDLIAECVALAWKWFARLAERGKDGCQFPTGIATLAVKAVRSGRRVVGQERAKDAMTPENQQRHGFTVAKLPDFSTLNSNPLQDALIDNTQSPPDEQAAFRIDFAAWLGTFDCRRRDIYLDMAMGHGTGELAEKYGVSPSRISQMRREATEDWETFHGGRAA